MAAATMNPPAADKKSHEMELFGDVRTDNYYWLRHHDPRNPDVVSYLHAENAYTNREMSDTKQFQKQLYTEIRGRIMEYDISLPVRKRSYYCHKRMLEGKEYVQHCKRHVLDGGAPHSVHYIMPAGDDAPHEHVLLDENSKGQEQGYFEIGCSKDSPDGKFTARAVDTKGDEIYTVSVLHAGTNQSAEPPFAGASSCIEWVGNEHFLYITMDVHFRAHKVCVHKVGTEQSQDVCLYYERDDKFSLYIYPAESRKYLFVASFSKSTGFVFHLDISNMEEGLKPVTDRVDGIYTSVSHRGDHFFILRRSGECFNSELLACPVDNVHDTVLLLGHRPNVKLQAITLFQDHLVTDERENGLPKLVVYHLPPVGESLKILNNGEVIGFSEPAYSIYTLESEFFSSVLRYCCSSLRTPPSEYNYDMLSGVSVLVKTEPVLGGFDASNYVTERKFATASDNTEVPISIVYRKDSVKLDGSDPLFLSGYGSYEDCFDAEFIAEKLSLLDRGFVYAIAHVRGGGEMGRSWYEDGKLLNKKNTFTDFIACAEYLLKNKYGSKEKLCIKGTSAGGMLIGAVLNMRPDLFKVAVAEVPFVDVLTTMLDPTIPLTTLEWEEWGDPRTEEFYHYIKSYSPVDNVKSQNYPHILVTAGLHDSRVKYWEPAKFVAKLREMKTDDNILLFKCELDAGHFFNSERFGELQAAAFTYAFIFKTLNMIPSPSC